MIQICKVHYALKVKDNKFKNTHYSQSKSKGFCQKLCTNLAKNITINLLLSI